MREVQAAASRLVWQLHVDNAQHQSDIDALRSFVKDRVEALYRCPDPFFATNRDRSSLWRRDSTAGDVFSASLSKRAALSPMEQILPTRFGSAGGYVDAFSRARSPPTCRSQPPTKYELVINLKTAKALGLEVPPTLLARADEVIE